MITGPTKVHIYHDTHTDTFTVQLGWCEPAPGLSIEGELEGRGETLSDALRELADEVKAQYETEADPLNV